MATWIDTLPTLPGLGWVNRVISGVGLISAIVLYNAAVSTENDVTDAYKFRDIVGMSERPEHLKKDIIDAKPTE
jgi:hypothetical protein